MSKFGIVIHGGAGTILPIYITPDIQKEYTEKLTESISTGYEILEKGGSSLDAVQAAVIVMEDSPLFNAGKGAVFTNEGTNEQDASIMDGVTLNAGAVCGITKIKNPIKLARCVMDKSEHVLLSGEGAERFAKRHNLEFADSQYFFTEKRWKQLQKAKEKETKEDKAFSALDHSTDKQLGDEGKHGTVGAVALDKSGNLAAATSSGGMTNKKFSRVGDSPIIGAGTYANNKACAVSTTGHGEYFMRGVTSYDLHALMVYKNMSLHEAADEVIHKTLQDLGGTGGLIAIDRDGHFALPFNTPGMYRGYRMSNIAEPMTFIFDK